MRIVHTADWHLGDRLGRIDRTDDLRRQVEQIAQICSARQADVLLIAGDLFSELARPDGLREAIAHLQVVFDEFLGQGGTILAITGNHDNENFCETLCHAMSLAAPAQQFASQQATRGRLYLATQPTWLLLPDATKNFDVGFVLMPFPSPVRYLPSGVKYADFEEKNRLLSAAFSQVLGRLTDAVRLRCSGPLVMVGHITVSGAHELPLFRMAHNEDVVLPLSQIPSAFAYVALGHIHVPTAVADHIRYCGSIDRLDLGERNDQKGVVFLDVDQSGFRSMPEFIPLDATPIYDVVIAEPSRDLQSLPARFPQAQRDLVRLTIRYHSGRDSLEEILRQLDKVFPRWYTREWHDVGQTGPEIDAAKPGHASFRDVVLDYLNQELVQYDLTERSAILERAERLIAALEQGIVAS
jgi:exonuclease SbcD